MIATAEQCPAPIPQGLRVMPREGQYRLLVEWQQVLSIDIHRIQTLIDYYERMLPHHVVDELREQSVMGPEQLELRPVPQSMTLEDELRHMMYGALWEKEMFIPEGGQLGNLSTTVSPRIASAERKVYMPRERLILYLFCLAFFVLASAGCSYDRDGLQDVFREGNATQVAQQETALAGIEHSVNETLRSIGTRYVPVSEADDIITRYLQREKDTFENAAVVPTPVPTSIQPVANHDLPVVTATVTEEAQTLADQHDGSDPLKNAETASKLFVGNRFRKFENEMIDKGFDEGWGFQCVAGAKWYTVALGLPVVRADGGYMVWAPSQPNPGYPTVALDDWRERKLWEDSPVGSRSEKPPPHSIAPPYGTANIDGQEIPYHIEEVHGVYERGDIIIFNGYPPHVGIFAAYTQSESLLVFNQNGGGNGEPFRYDEFPLSQVYGALRVVYDRTSDKQSFVPVPETLPGGPYFHEKMVFMNPGQPS